MFRIEVEDVDGGLGVVKYYKENGRYWCRRYVALGGGGCGMELNSEIREIICFR